MLVSKKKYNAMVAERDKWANMTAEVRETCESFRGLADKWEKIALDTHTFNKKLVAEQQEMLAKIKELEQQKENWRTRALGAEEQLERYEEGKFLTREAE